MADMEVLLIGAFSPLSLKCGGEVGDHLHNQKGHNRLHRLFLQQRKKESYRYSISPPPKSINVNDDGDLILYIIERLRW